VTPSRTERLLRIFTDVQPREGRTSLVLFANVFLILCAYYLIKPLREGWISVSDIGNLSKMEVKAYSAFGQSLFLIGVVSVYGRMASRLARARLITFATLFLMSNLVIFWLSTSGWASSASSWSRSSGPSWPTCTTRTRATGCCP
jgi:AAA family ATP:ADP antiporter